MSRIRRDGTFSGQGLQVRNPCEIDRQAHFTASAPINATLAALALVLAYTQYAEVAQLQSRLY
jgi:hypothetical protein